VSKHGSKERIGQSIDGILGNLTIRGRDSEKDKELEELKRSLEILKQEKEDLLQSISDLRQERNNISKGNKHEKHKSVNQWSLYEKEQCTYQPSAIIHQYCEQAEGKRKLTIHLREIEYQAILKASQHFHSSKGQLMDTITKALRFYIPEAHYVEAEREVLLKAIHSVRGMLEQLGFSKTDIEKKIKESLISMEE
jgi:prefoldin subunit 5